MALYNYVTISVYFFYHPSFQIIYVLLELRCVCLSFSLNLCRISLCILTDVVKWPFFENVKNLRASRPSSVTNRLSMLRLTKIAEKGETKRA